MDLHFHIVKVDPDYCFELESQYMLYCGQDAYSFLAPVKLAELATLMLIFLRFHTEGVTILVSYLCVLVDKV